MLQHDCVFRRTLEDKFRVQEPIAGKTAFDHKSVERDMANSNFGHAEAHIEVTDAHPALLFPESDTEPIFEDCEHAAASVLLDDEALIDALAIYARVARRAVREPPDDDALL